MPKHSYEMEEKYRTHLIKALSYLEKSFAKAQKLPVKLESCTDDQLETWESFTSRFARVVDIFLTKYLRILVLKSDPGFEGTLKDLLNFAEKEGLVPSAELYLSFREYRNIQAHDYTEDSFESFVRGLLANTPEVLKIKKIIDENH